MTARPTKCYPPPTVIPGKYRTVFPLLSGLFLFGLAKGEFAFRETDDALHLSESGVPVLVFNHGMVEPPQGRQGIARTGYVHPLHGPDGDVLTDDFPPDHPHHRGVFFGWPRMTVLGREVDYWHLRGLRPTFEEWGMRWIDGPRASFASQSVWKTEEGTPAVREELRYEIHASDETGRMIDIHSVFTNLTEQNLTISGSPGAAYGGLNLRMDGKRPGVRITAAGGAIEGNVNELDPPSPWADHSSRAGPERPYSGVALFQHPDNPGYPAKNWTLRPYGFLGGAWPGQSNHVLAPGKRLELRYRLFVHRGTAEDAGVEDRFQSFLKDVAAEGRH